MKQQSPVPPPTAAAGTAVIEAFPLPTAKPPGDQSRRYKRGYTAPPDLNAAIAKAHRTRPWVTILTALGDSVCVAALGTAAAWTAIALSPYLAVPASVLCVILTGRQLRGLECLVHEGSHFNWWRQRRKANDVLAALLAGMPTGARIADYRRSHLLHHGRFGTNVDPDLVRYQQLGLESLDRGRFGAFAGATIVRLPQYQAGWLATVTASPVSLVGVLFWAIMWMALPAWLAFGLKGAGLAIGVWLTSYVLALPTIRFVGESSEHLYSDANTVFDATVSNVGMVHRLLIHPHNDGYHTAHHMWPGVPHHQLRRLHNELVTRDAASYGRNIRYRTRVLQDAGKGL